MNILRGIGKAFLSNTTVVGARGAQAIDCKVYRFMSHPAAAVRDSTGLNEPLV